MNTADLAAIVREQDAQLAELDRATPHRAVWRQRPVSRAALDALRRLEQLLGSVVTPRVLLAVVRELRGTDPLTVEVGRAGTVERLLALGVADAEHQVDEVFNRYGLVVPDDRTLPRQWWNR